MLVVTLSLLSHACSHTVTAAMCHSADLQYLNPKSRNDRSLDDVSGFKMMVMSMDSIGMTADEKADLMQLTAAILHLGNITFDEYTKDNKGQRQCFVTEFVGGVCACACACVCLSVSVCLSFCECACVCM